MTTIVAIQGKTFSLICTDSRISTMTDDGFVHQINNAKQGFSKVSENGPYLIATAGDVRAINIINHVFTPPKPPLNTKTLDKFITNQFIPKLRTCFENEGYGTNERETPRHGAEHSSTLLVSVKGQIYLIDGDYSWVTHSDGIYTIGTGSQYATGALHALKTVQMFTKSEVAEQIATKALKITTTFDPHTGPPYMTYTQQQ